MKTLLTIACALMLAGCSNTDIDYNVQTKQVSISLYSCLLKRSLGKVKVVVTKLEDGSEEIEFDLTGYESEVTLPADLAWKMMGVK